MTEVSLNEQLIKACSSSYPKPQTIRELLEHGADPNVVRLADLIDDHGRRSCLEGLALLLKAGADPNQQEGKALKKSLGIIGIFGNNPGDSDALAILLSDPRTDPNLQNGFMIRRCIQGDRLEFLKKLVAAGGVLDPPAGWFGHDNALTMLGPKSSTEMIHYLLSPEVGKDFTRDQISVAQSSILIYDRTDLLEALAKPYGVCLSPEEACRKAALAPAPKILEWLGTHHPAHTDELSGLLVEVVKSLLTKSRSEDDSRYASVLSHLVRFGVQDDFWGHRDLLANLARKGFQHALAALEKAGLAEKTSLWIAQKIEAMAATVVKMGESHGFEIDSDQFPNLALSTRENAVSDDKASPLDVKRGRALAQAILAAYPMLSVDVDVSDEWVHVSVRLPQDQWNLLQAEAEKALLGQVSENRDRDIADHDGPGLGF